MKINKINILAFGKLKDKEITFSDNLNIIYGRNESGKSTVAAFIEAMLYSFPARDKDRGKYFPWDKSMPQGIMTITHNGKCTDIYRSFGTSPKYDTLEITPPVSLDEIIPKNRDTYRKSIFCSEGKASDFEKTDEMERKIANIMATGDENLSASTAIELLREKRKEFVKRGSLGRLYEIKETITRLENELALSQKNEEKLSNLKKQLSKKVAELSAIEEKCNNLNAEKNEDFTPPPAPKFFTLYLLLYIICAISLFIIGFINYKPLIYLSFLPILIYVAFFLIKKVKVKRQLRTNQHQNSLRKAKKQQLITSLTQQMLSLQREIHLLDKELSSFDFRPCDELQSQIAYYKNVKATIEDNIKAIDCAIAAIEYARESILSDFTPSVNKKAMEYLSRIAPKEGRNVTLSKDMSLFVTDPMPIDIASCSYGFTAEMYLCFRIALSEFLYGKDFPLIFDDPFLGSDDFRENELIDLFTSLARDHQIIIFTNRKNSRFNQLNCNFVDMNPKNDV